MDRYVDPRRCIGGVEKGSASKMELRRGTAGGRGGGVSMRSGRGEGARERERENRKMYNENTRAYNSRESRPRNPRT